ncbi:OmpP1/FadL family transporter [Algibacter sp. L1A34]|uniref:OmpP1/FadL family transporter n=1 Tax=Algibacter sp. L1A34 TaxID=2686365 RepID=UPI0018EEDC40|nr:outer membrane protein transport protein [Algibacter sp. L1A34]
MKKLNLLFIGVLSMSSVYAQDISDALRYSQDEVQGSARFRALSGAFGALGGDMSAVSINPAGSAVFSQSHASVSLVSADKNNTTNYFGNTEKVNDSKFSLNQGGAAFVFKSNSNSPWKKFTLAFAYDKTNDHNNNWYSAGINTNDLVIVDGDNNELTPVNSIANYFFQYAQGQLLQNISLNNRFIENAYQEIGQSDGFNAQQAFLGYQSFVLEPVSEDNNNEFYDANVASGYFEHRYANVETGYNGKISFNFAAQYEDNVYLGVNLNSHFIDYERKTSLQEDNDNGGLISFIDFDNTLSTTGNGFSFQIGGIFKLSQEFRLGLTYDSPTWYNIQEEITQFINTNEAESDIGFISDVITTYPEYKLQTPGKFTGSLAYIFGKQGLISFDYSNKNYSKTKFKPESDYSVENSDISNVLTSASTYRFGGEYKVKQISFRGGYRFEESPYTDGVTVGDLNGFSLGLGYNFGNTKLDLTFDQAKRSYQTPLYNVGLIDTVDIDRVNSNLTLSLSFNI